MRREVEVDTALAALHGRLAKVRNSLDSNKVSLARKLGVKGTYVTRKRYEVTETAAQLLATAQERLSGEMQSWERRELENVVARRGELERERCEITGEMAPLNDEFAAAPWSRFFLVQNHGGHIHSSMSCSTCFPTTLFGWLPELSGLTEKDAVEAYGPLLCTVCYPSAPVEWTVGKQQDDENKCPGSGTYDHTDFRRTSYSGSGRAKCAHCGATQSVTTSGRLRKHDKPEVTA